MTKKDYDLVARAINKQWLRQVEVDGKGDKSVIVHYVALRLDEAFRADNPRYNPDKFLTACGIED